MPRSLGKGLTSRIGNLQIDQSRVMSFEEKWPNHSHVLPV